MVFLPGGLTLLSVQSSDTVGSFGVASPRHRAGRVAQGPGGRLWGCLASGGGPGARGQALASALHSGVSGPPLGLGEPEPLQSFRLERQLTGSPEMVAFSTRLPRPGPASTLCCPPPRVCPCPAEAPSPHWGPGRGQAPGPPRSPGCRPGLRGRYGARAPHGRLSVETRHLETPGPLWLGCSLPSPAAILEGALPSCFGVGTRCPRCSGPTRTPEETATG